MSFVFFDKVSALRSLIETADPAAEGLVRELLPDRNHHLDAVAGLVRLDLARNDRQAARIHVERLIRVTPPRIDFITLGAAIALADGRHRDVLALAARAGQAINLDVTMLRIALQSASALQRKDQVQTFAARLTGLGALSSEAASALDALIAAEEIAGWVSATDNQGLAGAVRGGIENDATVSWHKAGQGIQTVQLAEVAHFDFAGSITRFQVLPATIPANGLLNARLGEADFIGSPIRTPVRAQMLGSVMEHFGEVTGWAWSPGDPERTLEVSAIDASGNRVDFAADGPSGVAQALVGSGGACGFTIDIEQYELTPGLIAFEAMGVPLSGSPVMVNYRRAAARSLATHRRASPRAASSIGEPSAQDALSRVPIVADARGDRPGHLRKAGIPRGRAVLIPVYDGLEETLACLSSVIRTVPVATRIVVVDDASPNPQLSEALLQLAQDQQITLLRNESNLGYPGSVNRGLAALEGYDVVLLNADALVANDWLDRLTAACYSDTEIGTVTALAPSGSIASYATTLQNPTAEDIEVIDQAARVANPGETVDVPTGVGHCLYLRADCLAEVGLLDAVTFGRGYGEENDFCLRAQALGWRNVVAADVFVGHVGERSFGAQRRILSHRNGAIIERLYPNYDAVVARHIAANPLGPARRRIDHQRLRQGSPVILIVTMGWKGGVATHVDDRVERLARGGQRVFTLQALAPSTASARKRCRLMIEDQSDLQDLIFDEDEFDDLVALLRAHGVSSVEYHHTLHHDPRVFDLPDMLNVPHRIVVHDYSWICPRMSLIGGSGRYCGEPDDAACDRCVASYGSISGENIAVRDLRARSRRFFGRAEMVVAPCRDVAARLERYVGAAPMTIVPWDEVRPKPSTPPKTGRLTVALPGAIGLHKGFAVLKACAEDAAARDLPLDFIVIGYSEDDFALLSTGRVFITGEYEPEELPDLLSITGADVVLLASICPETWSYTMSEVWRAGLDILAFDLGAIAERIRAFGGGRLLPPDSTASAVNDALLVWKRPSFASMVAASEPTIRRAINLVI